MLLSAGSHSRGLWLPAADRPVLHGDPLADGGTHRGGYAEAALQVVVIPGDKDLAAERDAGDLGDGAAVGHAGHGLALAPGQVPGWFLGGFELLAGEELELADH